MKTKNTDHQDHVFFLIICLNAKKSIVFFFFSFSLNTNFNNSRIKQWSREEQQCNQFGPSFQTRTYQEQPMPIL